MQRDEFLPLRVIRQELASGAPADDGAGAAGPRGRRATAQPRAGAPSVRVRGAGALYSLEDVLEDTRADPRAGQRAEEYGVIKGETRGGRDATTTRPSARSSARSPSWRATASAGATCACSAPPPTARPSLLQQILAPALRSRNPERRKEALEALENLAAVATHLKHLLLVRDLRKHRALS